MWAGWFADAPVPVVAWWALGTVGRTAGAATPLPDAPALAPDAASRASAVTGRVTDAREAVGAPLDPGIFATVASPSAGCILRPMSLSSLYIQNQYPTLDLS